MGTINRTRANLWERGLPAMAAVQSVKFLGELVGYFPHAVAVCMNWCVMGFIDSLGLSLQIQ
ncbi:hypothetical protein KRR23_04960 [Pseudomonas sp. CVAP|uniref:hypothetical protein n=1 Tax=Pseudomonas sp. CVAP\|nr:hypothetical protein [Pseudomonas sp. CVAP\